MLRFKTLRQGELASNRDTQGFPGSSADESAYNQEIPVWFLGEEYTPEKGQVTYFSILGLPW